MGGYNEQESLAPLVLEQQGILLSFGGILATQSNIQHLSVMIKLKKPKIARYSNNCNKVCSEEQYKQAIASCKLSHAEVVKDTPFMKFENQTIWECGKACTRSTECKVAEWENEICYLFNMKPKISRSTYKNSKIKHVINATCSREHLKELGCSPDLSTELSDLLSIKLNEDIESYWEETQTHLSELTETRPQKKEKRQAVLVAGFMGAAVTGLFAAGFG